jgi:hypothetical protein
VTTLLSRLLRSLGLPNWDESTVIVDANAPFAGRVDPTKSAEWIRRTLTDEPGKGMGAPFSEADAQLFLRACGRPHSKAAGDPMEPANAELLQRMADWLRSHPD